MGLCSLFVPWGVPGMEQGLDQRVPCQECSGTGVVERGRMLGRGGGTGWCLPLEPSPARRVCSAALLQALYQGAFLGGIS